MAKTGAERARRRRERRALGVRVVPVELADDVIADAADAGVLVDPSDPAQVAFDLGLFLEDALRARCNLRHA